MKSALEEAMALGDKHPYTIATVQRLKDYEASPTYHLPFACIYCQKACMVPYKDAAVMLVVSTGMRIYCDSCAHHHQSLTFSSKQDEYIRAVTKMWLDQTPEAFHKVDPARAIPDCMILLATWDGTQSVWLAGASQIGKSWTAYQLTKRAMLKGHQFASIDPFILKKYAKGHGEARDSIVATLLAAKIVIVDDFDKMIRGPDLYSLFEIIKTLADHGKVFITTSNMGRADYEAWVKADGDRATVVPLMKRMRESSIKIEIAAKPKEAK